MLATIMIWSASVLLAAWLFFQIGAFGSSFIWCSRQKRKCSISISKGTCGPRTEKNEYQKPRMIVSEFFEGITRYAIKKTSNIPSFHVRNFLYRRIFHMDISKRTIIYSGCEFRSPYLIRIGESVIGPDNIIDGRCGIVIGDHVCTGSGVKLWTMQHDPQSSSFGVKGGGIRVSDYAWIASFSTVLPCRNIGEDAVVSTGAVVTKDCEPYTIYAGIPAVPKGTREQKLSYELRRHWWFV